MAVPHYLCSDCGRCICKCACVSEQGRYTCPVCSWTLAYEKIEEQRAAEIVGQHRFQHLADGVGVPETEGLVGRGSARGLEDIFEGIRQHLVTTRLD